MRREGRALLGASAFLAWAFTSSAFGCTAILDLDSYEDAAAKLCECPGFEKLEETCATVARDKLGTLDAKGREAWLSAYTERKCGTICARAAECYSDVLGCTGEKTGCECCAWNNVVIECNPTACQPCETCWDRATTLDETKLFCVSGKARFDPLYSCACDNCPQDCTGFCQKNDPLVEDLTDPCRGCLNTKCKAVTDECLSDKP